jgi:hypothetical protein
VAKYHLNRAGEAGKCSATKGKCPFGDASEHYDSQQAAAQAYESSMSEQLVPSVAKLRDDTPAEDASPSIPTTISLQKLNGETTSMKVQEAGTTGKKCVACKAYMTQRMVDALQDDEVSYDERHTFCHACKKLAMWDGFAMPYEADVNRAEAHFLVDEEAVREARWYHSTFSADWQTEAQEAGVFIHAGTKDAAEERINHISEYDEMQTRYIYELRVKPQAKLNEANLFDGDDFPKTPSEAAGTLMPAEGISRYVNQWEAAGSVSLISTLDNFEVVGKVTLQ